MKRKIDNYKTHDLLTDKKLLNTITTAEELELEKIREELDNKKSVKLLNEKIKKYQKLLKELRLLKCK